MSVLSAAGISSDAKRCLSLWLLLFARTGFSCCCFVVGAFVFDVVQGWFALFATTLSRRAQQFPRHFCTALGRELMRPINAAERSPIRSSIKSFVFCLQAWKSKKFRLPAWSWKSFIKCFSSYLLQSMHMHARTAYKQTCPTLGDSASSKKYFNSDAKSCVPSLFIFLISSDLTFGFFFFSAYPQNICASCWRSFVLDLWRISLYLFLAF